MLKLLPRPFGIHWVNRIRTFHHHRRIIRQLKNHAMKVARLLIRPHLDVLFLNTKVNYVTSHLSNHNLIPGNDNATSAKITPVAFNGRNKHNVSCDVGSLKGYWNMSVVEVHIITYIYWSWHFAMPKSISEVPNPAMATVDLCMVLWFTYITKPWVISGSWVTESIQNMKTNLCKLGTFWLVGFVNQASIFFH